MSEAKLAYAIWSWGVNEKEQMIQALKDVKEVGYDAFESVKASIELFDDDLSEFKDIVEEYGVKPVSFYLHQTGNIDEDVHEVEKRLEFFAENNIKRMSIQGPGIKGRKPTQEELENVLKTIQRIGEVAKPYGVVPCVHPHKNTMIMYEDEIDFIMQNTDPEYVAFGPDTAHLVTGDCDPYEIFKRYIDRIKFMHLKDIKFDAEEGEIEDASFGVEVYSDFLELGEGDIDFKPIFDLLKENNYDGYLTIELDRTRFTHKKSAEMNMKFMKENYYNE